MICEMCKQEVTGENFIHEGTIKDGTMFVLIIRSRECDWMSCEGCNAPVHILCYSRTDIRYCNCCIEKLEVRSLATSEGDSEIENIFDSIREVKPI